MTINGVIIHDTFMFDTVKNIAHESGITNLCMIVGIYQELYNKTDAQNKSWNCKMIDEILSKKVN